MEHLMSSPQSQPSSSSEQSDSIIYEDLLSQSNNVESTNNDHDNNIKANTNAQIVYNKIDKRITASNGTNMNRINNNNNHTHSHKHKRHNINTNKNINTIQKRNNNNGYTNDTMTNDIENINEDNIARELAKHPCTPRPHKLSYNESTHTTHTKQTQKNRPKHVKSISQCNFTKQTLKPIRTPRPESVGIDSTDDEDDDEDCDDSDTIHVPGDDATIAEEDQYTLKQKEKWMESQKGPSYHAYTTDNGNKADVDVDVDEHLDEIKQDKVMPNNKKDKPKKHNNSHNHKHNNHNQHNNHKHHIRGLEYFPEEELDGRYEFIRYLGHGAYGYVAEGRHIATGKKVAIKKILKIFHNRIDAKRLLRELKILRVLRGLDSIVQLIDILPPRNFETFNQIILVFEFIDTDLSKLIQSDQYFTKLHVQYMLYQVLLGLKFMHSLNIFHRDLKPANILVNEDVSLKICDFGLARCTYNNQQFIMKYGNKNKQTVKRGIIINNNKRKHGMNYKKKLTQHVVTRWYRAPEVILLQQTREYLGAVDMWSVGCIFGELLQMLRENLRSYQHRKPIFPGQSSIPLSPPSDPFPSMDQLTVIFGIIGTPTPEEILNIDNERAARFLMQIPKCLPQPLKNMYPGADEQALSLLRGLLQFDVEKRITVDEALSHPFIQHVRDEQNEKKFDKIINKIKYTSNSLNFEFEDIKMKMDTYRSLIIEEVLRYNKHLCHKSADATEHDFV